MALDTLPSGSGSFQPHGALCLPAGKFQPCVHELAHCFGTRLPRLGPRLGGREGSWAGTGWHLGCGRSPLPVGLRLHGLRQPGLQEAPQESQAPEVADKAGLCP